MTASSVENHAIEVVADLAHFEAVPAPGSGANTVNRLAIAAGVQRIVGLLETQQMLEHAGFAKTDTQLISAFVEWMIGKGSSQLCKILKEPAMSAWISRISLHVEMLLGPRASSALRTRVEREIGQLPVLLLGILGKMGLEDRSFKVWVDSGFRTAPVGLNWHVRSTDNKWQAYTLETYERRVVISDTQGVVAEIDNLCEIGRESVIVHQPDKIRIEPRRWLTKYTIELLRSGAYPELAQLRIPEEKTSRLSDQLHDQTLGGAIDVIACVWPEAIHDIEIVGGVLPMSMPDTRWNSASTDDLPSVMQLTVKAGAEAELLAESVIHEASHVKLDAACKLDDMLLNPRHEKNYFHPWRPDPRPLFGVFYGAHAFLAVAMLWKRILAYSPEHPFAQRELLLRRKEVGEALETLENHADFTPLGRNIYDSMCHHHAELY